VLKVHSSDGFLALIVNEKRLVAQPPDLWVSLQRSAIDAGRPFGCHGWYASFIGFNKFNMPDCHKRMSARIMQKSLFSDLIDLDFLALSSEIQLAVLIDCQSLNKFIPSKQATHTQVEKVVG